MTIANVHIIFSLLVLVLIAAMLILGSRFKRSKPLSPLAGLSFAFIVAGIFFGGSGRILGYGLLAVGVVLAVGDIIVKAGRVRGRGKKP